MGQKLHLVIIALTITVPIAFFYKHTSTGKPTGGKSMVQVKH